MDLKAVGLINYLADSSSGVIWKDVEASLGLLQTLHVVQTVLHPGLQLGHIVLVGEIGDKALPIEDFNVREGPRA